MTAVMAPARPAWVPSELYPFMDRYIEVKGNLVHYVDEGAGPPLLLLHGNPTWSFAYRGIIQRLSESFRCVALDYPGFGMSVARGTYDFRPASHAQVVETFVERLGLDGITIMGSDWGGPIGLWFAGRRPARVRALVLGNTWAWPARERRLRLFSALVGGPLAPLLVERLNLFINVFLQGGVRRRKLSAAEMTAYRGPFPRGRRQPMRVFPREIVASRAFLQEVESGLARLSDKSVLITWADGDVAFKDPELRRLEELFPRHRTVIVRNAGHEIAEDAPDDIADAIEAWWTEEVEGLRLPEAEPSGRALTGGTLTSATR
jgi:haloalkane dehalogenase